MGNIFYAGDAKYYSQPTSDIPIKTKPQHSRVHLASQSHKSGMFLSQMPRGVETYTIPKLDDTKWDRSSLNVQSPIPFVSL